MLYFQAFLRSSQARRSKLILAWTTSNLITIPTCLFCIHTLFLITPHAGPISPLFSHCHASFSPHPLYRFAFLKVNCRHYTTSLAIAVPIPFWMLYCICVLQRTAVSFIESLETWKWALGHGRSRNGVSKVLFLPTHLPDKTWLNSSLDLLRTTLIL